MLELREREFYKKPSVIKKEKKAKARLRNKNNSQYQLYFFSLYIFIYTKIHQGILAILQCNQNVNHIIVPNNYIKSKQR